MLTRKQFKTAVIILAALYILIFIGRSIYDIITYDDPIAGDGVYYSGLKSDSSSYSVNVASLRRVYDGEAGVEILDQKYERVASVSTKTVSYDADLARLDAVIEQCQAVVQMENAQGLSGSRKLSRVIGVKPQYFDDCLASIQEIGILISSASQKKDKTYEYRQMLAQKQELEKRLESYNALRTRSGSIDELLGLEDKIIGVESQLLQQSVDLGEYSDNNALCTINLSLYEGNQAGLSRKVWNAFVWTNKCYFAVLGGVILICLAAVLLVKIYLFFRKLLTSEKRADISAAAEKQNAQEKKTE